MARRSPPRSSSPPPPCASGCRAPRRRSSKPAFRSRFPSAKSCRTGWTPCSMRSTRASLKGGPTRAALTSIRRDLTDEAMFLARLVVELLPQEAEALGLLALMLHAEARRPARRNAAGDYVPLAEQDPRAVERADDRRGRERCCIARAHSGRSGAINSKRRCSRRMPIAAALGATIGRRSCSSTMRFRRSRARRWSQSIARSRLRSCTARKPPQKRCKDIAADDASHASINPTGPHALSCYRRPVRTTKRVRPTRWRSVSSANPTVRAFLQKRQKLLRR